MPTATCETCGLLTNSTCSDYWEHRGEKVTECYAARKDDKWVKGCSFDDADDFSKAFAMSLITGKDITTFLKRMKE